MPLPSRRASPRMTSSAGWLGMVADLAIAVPASSRHGEHLQCSADRYFARAAVSLLRQVEREHAVLVMRARLRIVHFARQAERTIDLPVVPLRADLPLFVLF